MITSKGLDYNYFIITIIVGAIHNIIALIIITQFNRLFNKVLINEYKNYFILYIKSFSVWIISYISIVLIFNRYNYKINFTEWYILLCIICLYLYINTSRMSNTH